MKVNVRYLENEEDKVHQKFQLSIGKMRKMRKPACPHQLQLANTKCAF